MRNDLNSSKLLAHCVIGFTDSTKRQQEGHIADAVPSAHDKRNQVATGSMPALKTEAVTLRLTPETKAILRQAAEHERRSLSNMLEVMIRDYYGRQTGLGTIQPDAASREVIL